MSKYTVWFLIRFLRHIFLCLFCLIFCQKFCKLSENRKLLAIIHRKYSCSFLSPKRTKLHRTKRFLVLKFELPNASWVNLQTFMYICYLCVIPEGYLCTKRNMTAQFVNLRRQLYPVMGNSLELTVAPVATRQLIFFWSNKVFKVVHS